MIAPVWILETYTLRKATKIYNPLPCCPTAAKMILERFPNLLITISNMSLMAKPNGCHPPPPPLFLNYNGL